LVQWIQIGTLIVSVLIGTGIISLVPVIYKPNIDIQVKPNEASVKYSIATNNTGYVAATHMILTVQSPVNITNEKIIFKTENVTGPTKIDPRTIQYYLPRLVHGWGSIIINISMVEKPNMAYPHFVIYATYDQGSKKFVNQKPLTSLEELSIFWKAYGFSLSLILYPIAYFPVVLFLSRKRKRKHVLFLIRELREFRNSIKDRPDTNEQFKSLKDGIIVHCTRTGLFDNITNILLIEDFYNALVNRWQIISDSSTVDPGSIRDINTKCLDLCERLLREVDWPKYRGLLKRQSINLEWIIRG
jgi:hypothetical protein